MILTTICISFRWVVVNKSYVKMFGIITILDILPLIDDLPVSLDKKVKIGGYLKNVVVSKDYNTCNLLIKYAIKNDFINLKQTCKEVFLKQLVVDPSISPSTIIESILATYLFGIYYRHIGKLDNARFYFKLNKYLACDKSITKQGATDIERSLLASKFKIIDARKTLNRSLDHYILKLDRTDNNSKWLSFCEKYFNLFHKLVFKVNEGRSNKDSSKLKYFGDVLLNFYKSHEMYDKHCLLFNKILRSDWTGLYPRALDDLLTQRLLIKKSEWTLLPSFLADYEKIMAHGIDSLLYVRIKDVNGTLSPTDDYVVCLCIYMWDNGFTKEFQTNKMFRFVVGSRLNENNSGLFILFSLYTINDYLDYYKIVLTRQIKLNKQAVFEVKYIKNPEICPIGMWENMLQFQKTNFMQNLEILCEYFCTKPNPNPNGYSFPDMCVYLFLYLLYNVDLCPSMFLFEHLICHPALDTIIISYRSKIEHVEMKLMIWQLVSRRASFSENQLSIVTGRDKLSLSDFVKSLVQIGNIKKDILNTNGGSIYSTAKAHFEDVYSNYRDSVNTISEPKLKSKLTLHEREELLREFLASFPKTALSQSFFVEASDKSVSYVQHLVLTILCKVARYLYINDPIEDVTKKYLGKNILAIIILVKEFKKFSKVVNFIEPCNIYGKMLFESVFHRTTVPIDRLFTVVLICLCGKMNYVEGLFQLFVPDPDIKLRILHKNNYDSGQYAAVLFKYIRIKKTMLAELTDNMDIADTILAEKMTHLLGTVTIRIKATDCQTIRQLVCIYSDCIVYEKFILGLLRLRSPNPVSSI